MPRNSTGVYTLPGSNPVTPQTIIATSWANPTLSDIANELTNSLDRSGRGGMLAPFYVFDGSLSLPGLGFLNELGAGLWRSATNTVNMAIAGANIQTWTPTGVNIAGTLTVGGVPITGAYLPLAGGTLTGLFTVQYNSAVIKLVDTLQGGSLMIYSDAATEMILDCFTTATPATKRTIWLNKYGGNVALAASGGAGRVAVGHGTPTCVLDVRGVANEPAQTWNVDGAGITTVLKRAADASGTAVFGTSSAHNFRLMAGGVETVFLTSAGNLGVGVTPTGFRGRSIDIQSTTGSSVIINTAVGSVSSLRFATIGSTDGWDINYNFPSVGDLGFHWNGAGAANRVTFSSTGNVGIGVAPTSKLDVFGLNPVLKVRQDGGAAGNASIQLRAAGGANYEAIDFSSGFMFSRTDGGTAIYFGPDTTLANARLSINGVTGNVGIGVAPTQKLTVSGNINALNYYIGESTVGDAGTWGFPNSNGPKMITWGTGTAGSGQMHLISADGSISIKIGAAGSLFLSKVWTIKQRDPSTLGVNAAWDWDNCPTHNYVASGSVVTGITNAVPGEMKRAYMAGAGSFSGPWAWATGSPVWGANGTVVSVVCVSPGAYVATTLPF